VNDDDMMESMIGALLVMGLVVLLIWFGLPLVEDYFR
jgi:hypothetical protein